MCFICISMYRTLYFTLILIELNKFKSVEGTEGRINTCCYDKRDRSRLSTRDTAAETLLLPLYACAVQADGDLSFRPCRACSAINSSPSIVTERLWGIEKTVCCSASKDTSFSPDVPYFFPALLLYADAVAPQCRRLKNSLCVLEHSTRCCSAPSSTTNAAAAW